MDDALKDAKEVVSSCEGRESENRAEAILDMRFAAGEQWDADWMGNEHDRTRMKRASLKVNQLPQYRNQVINDIRQNRPGIKVRPIDDAGDEKIADIFEGIVRHAQDVGKAESARDAAVEHQVTHGLGWYRMRTDYANHTSFEQEPVYQGIDEPLNVYHDDFREIDGSDMRHCVILSSMTKADFERDYPKQPVSSWGGTAVIDAEVVTIAEYYCVKTRPDVLLQLSDGNSILESEAKRRVSSGEVLAPPTGRERKVDVPYVYWRKLSGEDVLDERELVGTFIPVFPVVGNCVRIEGRPYRFGLIRFARDPQRYYNWLKACEVEYLENATKAPWVGDARAFAPFEQFWRNANRVNYSYLPLAQIDDSGNPIAFPQRNPPAPIPAGLMQAEAIATDDIKKSMGKYSAAIGAQGNETSGKAILARQSQSDAGTFHYADNLAKSVLHEGRVLMQWIPRLYGPRKVARIIGQDNSPSMARLTQSLPTAVTKVRTQQGVETVYNLGVGRYDVTVTVGPSYSTKRVEAASILTDMARADPTLMAKAGDIIVKAYDMPGGDALAKRLKAFLPPQVLQAETDTEQVTPEALKTGLLQVQQAMAQVDARAQAMQQIEAKMTERDQKLSEEGQKVASERTRLEAEKAVLEARAREIEANIELQARKAADELRRQAEQMQPAPQENLSAVEIQKIESARKELSHEKREAILEVQLQTERAKNQLTPLVNDALSEQHPSAAPGQDAGAAPAPQPQDSAAELQSARAALDLSDVHAALAMLLERRDVPHETVVDQVRSMVREELAKSHQRLRKAIEDARTVRVIPDMDDEGNIVSGTIVDGSGAKRKVSIQ